MVSGSPWQAGSLSRSDFLRWMLVLPVLMLLLALWVWLGDANRSLFSVINGADWPARVPFWSAITVLGDTLTLLLLLMLFMGRRTDLVWSVVVAVFVVSLFLHGGKILIDSPRPPALLAAEEIQIIGIIVRGSDSFPSGHTAAAFAFAAAICLLRFPVWLKGLAVLAAILAGISRIVVGAHWPLDVLVGACVGWLGMALSIWLAERMPWGMGLWSQRVIATLLLVVVVYALWGFDGGYPAARWVFVVLPLLGLGIAMPQLLRLYGVRQ